MDMQVAISLVTIIIATIILRKAYHALLISVQGRILGGEDYTLRLTIIEHPITDQLIIEPPAEAYQA